MNQKKVTATGTENGTTRSLCSVREQRGTIVYRCMKRAGHENDPNDAEHEAQADEYVHRTPDWRALFEASLPILEWVAEYPSRSAGDMKSDLAKRLLVRHYIAATNGPGLASARPRTP